MGFRVTAPATDAGYNRTSDWPVAAGAGFRVNGIAGGIGAGVNVNGTMAGSSNRVGNTNWHPTIVWMLGFVALELVAFNLLSRYLNI